MRRILQQRACGMAAGLAGALVLGAVLLTTAAEAQRPRFGPGALADARAADGTPAEATPEPLREVGFDQRLGEQVPLEVVFEDEEGRRVELGDFLGERPVVLSLVYYRCPMLCPMTLRGLASSLKALEMSVGETFDVVVVSFDPHEGPEAAAKAKLEAVHRYGRAGTEDGWHFLSGDAEAVERLTQAVGFRYTFDEQRDEYAHAAGVVLLTPEGRIARYFFGIEYPARDLKLGLVEAADHRIGSLVDQLLLYCFHYDPQTGQYLWSARATTALRWAGTATVLALVCFVLVMARQERRKNQATRSA